MSVYKTTNVVDKIVRFQGRFMSFLQDNKDKIASFSALVGTTLSIIALAVTAYSLRDISKSPSLVLQIANSDRFGHVAVTYNGGDAPCAEFKITYPESVGKVEQIIQYQESVITNAKFKAVKLFSHHIPLTKLVSVLMETAQ